MIKSSKKTVKQSVVQVSGHGPIISHTFEIPEEGGGIVVLRGSNGSGKSHSLSAFRTLLGADGKLVRNDEADEAVVEGFGSKVKMGRSQRRTGDVSEIGVEHIECDFSILDFVDPAVPDPAARTEHRIKALVRLSGAKVPFADFESLVPQHEAYPPIPLDDARKIGDTVDQAAKFKRIVQAEALRIEKLSAESRRQQGICEAAIGGVDVTTEPASPQDLQDAYAKAVQKHTSLLDQAAASDRVKQSRLKAHEELAKARLAYTGPTVEEAESSHAAAMQAVTDAGERVRALEQELLKARSAQQTAMADSRMAAERLESAKRHVDMLASFEAAVKTQDVPRPTEEQIQHANLVVEQSRKDIESAAVIRHALTKKSQADSHATEASQHERRAELLREAAQGADAVLSRAVKCVGLCVKHGELFHTGDGVEEVFDRLSDGERWKVAIRIASERVGAKGDGTRLIVVDQVGWQDLDPNARDYINDLCVMEGVWILTAECSRGPLRQVIYGQPDQWEQAQASNLQLAT